jgi:hypothetical protein
MPVGEWQEVESRRTLKRLVPRLAPHFAGLPSRQAAFEARLDEHFPRLFHRLHALYGWHYDFFWHLEEVLTRMAASFAARDESLVAVDAAREVGPPWFASNRVLGGVCYVDRFAGDLAGIRARIPYFRELGLGYLHLMPLFKSPPGENDGGYAVSDYRAVDPRLGTMDELAALARELRAAGIALVLDFILNHTADDHPWAEAAKAGDPDAQAFYWMFDDRRMPDQFQPYLRSIFPDRGGDSFTWRPDVAGPAGGKWVWDHLLHLPVGPQLPQPGLVHGHGRGDAVLGQSGRGRAPARRRAVLMEGARHQLREPAGGAHGGRGLERGRGHRRTGACLQVRGDRPPRRGRALRRPGEVPAVLQPLGDGASVGGGGHA